MGKKCAIVTNAGRFELFAAITADGNLRGILYKLDPARGRGWELQPTEDDADCGAQVTIRTSR